MGSSANLEVLPVELQRGILERIADVKTLQALIRASPRFFQIYKVYKEAIISQVVHNQMDPAYLPIAFDLHCLRETEVGGKIRELVIDYWNISRRKLHLCGPCSFSFATSKPLVSFHETVEYFISDFTEKRLYIIEKGLGFINVQSSSYGSTSESRSSLALSEVENSRLARAFYHFELLAGLFRIQELEEFYCVWSYLTEKRLAHVGQVEYHLSQGHNETNTRGSKLLCQQQWIEGDIYLSPWSISNFAPILRLGRSSALGLSAFRAILNANGLQDKPNTSTNNSSVMGWIEQTNEASYFRIKKLLFPQYGDCDFEDDIEKPNKGVLWALKGPNHADELSRVVRAGLTRWGHAIWDDRRLKTLGVLNKEITQVSEMFM